MQAKIRLILLLLTAGILAPAAVVAQQDSLFISIDEALEMASAGNFEVKQSSQQYEAARQRYRQTYAVYLPQVSVEYNAISTDNPLNVFGFRLMQKSVTQADFDPANLNDPGSFENYSTRFEIRQPLFNPDMMIRRTAAGRQVDAFRENERGKAEATRFQVKKVYFQLVLMQNQAGVLEEAYNAATEYYRMAQNMQAEGMLSREDMLSARVHQLEVENKLTETKHGVEEVRQQLALLLGLSGDTHIIPADNLVARNLAGAEEIAGLEVNNSFIRSARLQKEAAERMANAERFTFVPSVNLFGAYELNDKDVFGFGSGSYMVGLNVRWNLFSGLSNVGKAGEARAAAREAGYMMQHFEYEQENKVRQALRDKKLAENLLELGREAITQAEEDVRIRANRFKEGLERTTDLLMAETRLSEARLKKMQAVYHYNISIAALEMLLETDL